MDYRTILVHADRSVHAPGRIRLAARLAARMNAHLDGAAMTGISRFVCPQGYSGGPGDIICGYLDPVYDAARRMLDEFESVARAAGAVSIGRHLVSDQPDDGLARQAAFADLVVLSQNDPGESTSDVVTNLPEFVILNCPRPALVVPFGREFAELGRRVLVAWNGSREATAAIAGALPLLRGAEAVTVVEFDPQPHEAAPGVDPRADLVAWLARHQVQAAVMAREAGGDAAGALPALAAQLQCDLVVMGCYGHTRFRELLLGGATRTMLQSMAVPVLMAH